MKAAPLLALAAAALIHPAAAGELSCTGNAPLATSLRLDYAVTASRSILSLSGDGTVLYRRDGDGYTMESSLVALGVFEAQQRSAGRVGPQGLVPASFSQRSTRRPHRNVSFDWEARQVSFGGDASEPVQPQMQDRLSMLLQLAWRHRREPGARRFEMPVAGLRHVSSYVFNSQGAETVTTSAGRFETVKYERHKDDGDDALEVWLAPELCSLPVRVRFTDDKGLTIEQQLRALRPL